MPRLETWELLGLLFAAGSSVFGLIYAAPNIAGFSLSIRGATITLAPEAALGLAGLALTTLGSFASIFVGQMKPSGNNLGAPVIIWTNLVVLLLGDALFYSGQTQATSVMLLGLSSAVLTVLGLLVIAQRPYARFSVERASAG